MFVSAASRASISFVRARRQLRLAAVRSALLGHRAGHAAARCGRPACPLRRSMRRRPMPTQFDSEALWAQVQPQVRAGDARADRARRRCVGPAGGARLAGARSSQRPARRCDDRRGLSAAAAVLRRCRRAAAGAPKAPTAVPSGSSAARRRSPICAARCRRPGLVAAHAPSPPIPASPRPRARRVSALFARHAPGLDGAGRVDRILRMSDASVLNDSLQAPAARSAAAGRAARQRPRPRQSAVLVQGRAGPAGLPLRVLALVARAGALAEAVDGMQEQLARQSADALAQCHRSPHAGPPGAGNGARHGRRGRPLTETRLSEVALQRSQLEELMQSLSRSRDENLVVDIESAVAPGAAAGAGHRQRASRCWRRCKAGDQRLARAAQPRLARCSARSQRDTDRIARAPARRQRRRCSKLDELMRRSTTCRR